MALFLTVVLAACGLVLDRYYYTITRTAYDLVSYDSQSHELWMADITEGKLNVYVVENGNVTQDDSILLPENTTIWQLCNGLGVTWVETSNLSSDGDYVLYVVSTANGPLEEKLRTTDKLNCKALDEKVLFWDKDNIFVFGNSQMIEARIGPINEGRIWSVAIDNSGTYWYSTIYGEIYRRWKEGWKLWDKLPGDPTLLFDNNGSLWVATYEGVYRYTTITSQTSVTRDVIIKRDLGFTRQLIEDNHNRIWVISSNAFFAIKIDSGQILEAPFPDNSTLFRFGGIDNENDCLFISTEKGVYKFDLASFP